ncbi:SDR family NAD(P)-dependent oxidoreductase [Calidifontibacillus oryziterrae]|uniref:SDR family NAD(P)-dependent oxidoreductase n=1 Tax=Calidifontibacillus oryziterrae TaxID=1191699 RepID=UPI0002D9F287|nr:SDR family NAD(P)-dependent oxidoreductase [Calidifontibacillus oryziterrae]
MGLLDGKIAFITGASKGIGEATALVFSEEGARIAINGRDQQRLLELAERINKNTSQKVLVFPYDVSNIVEMKAAFQQIHKQFGQLDVLVNNAGTLYDSLLGMIQLEKLEEILNVNLIASLLHMQLASRIMTQKKQGSIINVSSIFGRFGEAGQVAYSTTKAALIGATMSAAKELAPSNIRVNAVAPGFIETEMIRGLSEAKYKKRMESIKMNRIGKPKEVANTMLFLASDLSSYVTGQVIGVDGGMIV